MAAPAQTIRLREFDMRWINDGSVILMLGKRNTGKSFLVRDLLANKRDIPTAVVISPTEQANRFYGDMIPPLFIHDEYSPEIMERLVTRQKRVKRMSLRDADVDPRTICILDDCLYNASAWVKDANIRYCCLNGRHVDITFVMTSQYALGLPPTIRGQLDYTFILRDNILRNRRIIYENYCGFLPSFEVFCSIMDQTTNDYELLVVCGAARSNRIEDQLFWYKAREHAPFQLCSREMWEMSNAHMEAERSDSEEEEERFNPDARRRNRLKVKKLPSSG
jgi:hypothetical protein